MPNLNGPWLGFWLTWGTVALALVGLYFAALIWLEHYGASIKAFVESLTARWNYRRVKRNEAVQYAEYNRVRREKLLATSRKLHRLK